MCFNELDDSGDGTLDQEEIEGLLKRIYGMEPTKKQMAQLMLEMGSDGNGVIDLDEFISAMATVKEVRMAGDIFKWRQTFDQYDEDQSGELSGDELKKMTVHLTYPGKARSAHEEWIKHKEKIPRVTIESIGRRWESKQSELFG